MLLQLLVAGLWLPVSVSAAPRPGEPAAISAVVKRQTPHLARMEVAIWNERSFRKRFTESYMAVTDIEPSVTLGEREHMQEVLERMASDKMDKAIALLHKHGGPGASAVFDFTLANIYFQSEDLDSAATHYRAALRKHARFQRAWGNLGLVLVRQEDFQGAAEAFTKVISLGGGDAVNYGLLGFSYSNLGNSLSAESAYRMAVLLDPLTMDWKRGLTRSLFKQSRFADAVALCDTLIAEQPGQPEFWLLQANAYIGLGQPLKAAEDYEIIERLGGSTATSLANLGDIYVNEGLLDLATNSHARALEREARSSPERAIRAARVMASHGDLAETARLVERIEDLRGEQLTDENKKVLLKLRARIAVADGAGDEEARVLAEIVALDPLDGEALILLGKHARRGNEPEQAAFYFERAASIEAFEPDAKVAHAQLLVQQGQYDQALTMLRRAQTLKPRESVQQYLKQVERVARKR